MVLVALVVQLIAAALVGSGVAWWFTRRALIVEFNQTLRQLTETHRKHHEAVVDKLNAAHAQSKKELENLRQAAPRVSAAAAAVQRSATTRLEEQLGAAYVELDRLRLEINGPAPTGRPLPTNGFADTQPFVSMDKRAHR